MLSNSFRLCYVHPTYIHFSLGNHLGTSLIIGNFMRIRVTSVERAWLGLEWPPTYYVALHTGDIVSSIS